MIFFFFFVVPAAGPQKWPSKNPAIPLMASHHSRHYKLGSGCHPFGIVVVDPSANFTRLNPGVTGSSSSCAGVLGVASALTPGQFGGRGNIVPGILVGFKGAAWNAGRHRGSSRRSHGCRSRWKRLGRRGLLTRSNSRLAKRHLLTLNELFEKLIAFLHGRCPFLVAIIERHKAFVRVLRNLKGFGGILHQLHSVEKILANVLSLAHQQFLHAHIDKLGAGAADLPSTVFQLLLG